MVIHEWIQVHFSLLSKKKSTIVRNTSSLAQITSFQWEGSLAQRRSCIIAALSTNACASVWVCLILRTCRVIWTGRAAACMTWSPRSRIPRAAWRKWTSSAPGLRECSLTWSRSARRRPKRLETWHIKVIYTYWIEKCSCILCFDSDDTVVHMQLRFYCGVILFGLSW